MKKCSRLGFPREEFLTRNKILVSTMHLTFVFIWNRYVVAETEIAHTAARSCFHAWSCHRKPTQEEIASVAMYDCNLRSTFNQSSISKSNSINPKSISKSYPIKLTINFQSIVKQSQSVQNQSANQSPSNPQSISKQYSINPLSKINPIKTTINIQSIFNQSSIKE